MFIHVADHSFAERLTAQADAWSAIARFAPLLIWLQQGWDQLHEANQSTIAQDPSWAIAKAAFIDQPWFHQPQRAEISAFSKEGGRGEVAST
jgi:hypothetical protein